MTTVILDGRTGQAAKVDNRSRLNTAAVITTDNTIASLDGDQFSISTEIINLTSATESALLFIKNTESAVVDWAITGLTINGAASANGVGDWQFALNKNPTAGTLISAGTTVAPRNRNVGNTSTLSGIFLEGAEASTITDGTEKTTAMISVAPGAVNAALDVVVMPQGTAIAVFVTPPTSNTSMNVTIGITLHRVLET